MNEAKEMEGKTVAAVEDFGEGGALIHFSDGTHFELRCREGESAWLTDQDVSDRARENALMERFWEQHNAVPLGEVAVPIGWGGFFRPIGAPNPVSEEDLAWMINRRKQRGLL